MGLFRRKKREEKPIDPDILKSANWGLGNMSYDAKQYEKAVFYWKKAAELGLAQAQYKLARMYQSGLGTEKDEAEAFHWYVEAAKGGNSYAQYSAGLCCLNGIGTEVDKVQAILYLRMADLQLDKDAKKLLAELKPVMDELIGTATEYYWQGRESEDLTERLSMYEKAAGLGWDEAQLDCGEMYYFGKGTEKDLYKARYWFEKAAEQGNVLAQYNCGVIYHQGQGTAVNEKKAAYWYEKAAKQGLAKAKYNLALLCRYGWEDHLADPLKMMELMREVAKQVEDSEHQKKAQKFIDNYYGR